MAVDPEQKYLTLRRSTTYDEKISSKSDLNISDLKKLAERFLNCSI